MHASLSNGDCLLLHNLMDCDSIDLVHLVELINTDDSPVRQHHCASLQCLLSRVLV
jgi:hypothetical protein